MLWWYNFRYADLMRQAFQKATIDDLARKGELFLTHIIDTMLLQANEFQPTITCYMREIVRSNEFQASILIRWWPKIKSYFLEHGGHLNHDADELGQMERLYKFHQEFLEANETFYMPGFKQADGSIELLHTPPILGKTFRAHCQAIVVDSPHEGPAFVTEKFRTEVENFCCSYPALEHPMEHLYSQLTRLHDSILVRHRMIKLLNCASVNSKPGDSCHVVAYDATSKSPIGRGFNADDARCAAAIYYLNLADSFMRGSWPFKIDPNLGSDNSANLSVVLSNQYERGSWPFVIPDPEKKLYLENVKSPNDKNGCSIQ